MKPQRAVVLLSIGSCGLMITTAGAGYGTGPRRAIGRVGRATIAERLCAAKRRREKSQRQRGVGLTERD
jgi:hypothetical protein